MHCQSCDYPLWNLRTRTCPECGATFRPSEIDFQPGAVRFSCPHCNQAYYGTGERGQLEPIEFDCVTCGRHVHMDEMVVLPSEGFDEHVATMPVVAWRRRESLGMLRAWFSTVGTALIFPHRLLANRTSELNGSAAFGFMALTIGVTCLASMAPLLMFFILLGLAAAAGPGVMMMSILIFIAVVAFILPLALAFFWTGVTHWLLRVRGGTPARGITRTFEAIAYSSGAYVIGAIPCFGGYVAPFWWPISATIAVKHGQNVSGGRAAFATLTLPIALFVLVIAAYMGLFVMGMMMSSAGPMQVSTQRYGQFAMPVAVPRLTTALVIELDSNDVVHASALIVHQNLDPMSYLELGSNTHPRDVPIGSGTLMDFIGGDVAMQRTLIEEASAVMPDKVIAHRVGDFVFTHHGHSRSTSALTDPDLWVVIGSPDPDRNPAPSPGDVVVVGTSGGATRNFAFEQFGQMLEAQNALRATHGLPPLPDPRTVTHGAPARDAGVNDD